MKSGIYKILNTINNKFYIGSSHYIVMRFSQHKYDLLNNKHPNLHLQRAFNKYGFSAFEFHILEHCEKEKLIEREQFYIDNLKPNYNLAPKAGSNLGFKHTEKTKEKMRKPKSETHKKNLSTAKLGKRLSEEQKLKIGLGNKGKIISKETRKKQSKALKGRVYTEERRLNIALGHRKLDKWPHLMGIRCKCEECKLKHKEYKANWYKNRK